MSPGVARGAAWQRLVAAGPPAWVLDHALAVEGLALAMAEAAEARGHEVDPSLVGPGAILHDIGRSVTQDVHHASIGARMLRDDASWPPALVRVVERHTGAGIDAAEAARLGLPVKDYTPRGLEERLVAHADNLFRGDKRLRVDQVVAKYAARGLGEAADRILRLHEDLAGLLGTDLDSLAPVAVGRPGP